MRLSPLQIPLGVLLSFGLHLLTPAPFLGAFEQDDKDAIIRKLKDDNAQLQLELQKQRLENADLKAVVLEKLKLDNKQLLAELDRQRKELDLILQLVKKTDAGQLALLQELTKATLDLKIAENRARTMEEQNQLLRKRLQDLEAAPIKKQVGDPKKNDPLPGGLNPPPVLIKGTIEKVNAKDRTLVELSVGGDAGLKTNHTLEVFRLKPTPMYLGVIRIVDVSPQRAIGRLVPSVGRQVVLQVGDQVISRFAPDELKK